MSATILHCFFKHIWQINRFVLCASLWKEITFWASVRTFSTSVSIFVEVYWISLTRCDMWFQCGYVGVRQLSTVRHFCQFYTYRALLMFVFHYWELSCPRSLVYKPTERLLNLGNIAEKKLKQINESYRCNRSVFNFTYHHIVDHGTSSNSYIPEGFYSHITGTIKHGRKVLLCHDGIKHDAVLIDAISHEGGSVQ